MLPHASYWVVYLYHVLIRSQYLDLGLGRERRPYLDPINNCIISSLTDIYCYWLISLVFCLADFLWFFSANRIFFYFILFYIFPLPFISSIHSNTPHPHQSPHCCLCSRVLSHFFSPSPPHSNTLPTRDVLIMFGQQCAHLQSSYLLIAIARI